MIARRLEGRLVIGDATPAWVGSISAAHEMSLTRAPDASLRSISASQGRVDEGAAILFFQVSYVDNHIYIYIYIYPGIAICFLLTRPSYFLYRDIKQAIQKTQIARAGDIKTIKMHIWGSPHRIILYSHAYICIHGSSRKSPRGLFHWALCVLICTAAHIYVPIDHLGNCRVDSSTDIFVVYFVPQRIYVYL